MDLLKGLGLKPGQLEALQQKNAADQNVTAIPDATQEKRKKKKEASKLRLGMFNTKEKETKPTTYPKMELTVPEDKRPSLSGSVMDLRADIVISSPVWGQNNPTIVKICDQIANYISFLKNNLDSELRKYLHLMLVHQLIKDFTDNLMDELERMIEETGISDQDMLVAVDQMDVMEELKKMKKKEKELKDLLDES